MSETTETIFSKIIRREIPVDIVYEDNLALAFKDIHPQAPVHILVIPKKPIPTLADAESQDHALLGHLLLTAKRVAEEAGLKTVIELSSILVMMVVRQSITYICIFWEDGN